MTRLQLLQLLIAQARANGFQFRRWYVSQLELPWQSPTRAVNTLVEHHLYYALLFSHEFAKHFWKVGTRITFQVPPQTFTRRMADGRIGIVHRKGFIRRSARENAWLFHLKEMAAAEDPLRYMRRYLLVPEDLDEEPPSTEDTRAPTGSPPSASSDVPHA